METPNPYTPTPLASTHILESTEESPHSLTDGDLMDLRIAARRAHTRYAQIDSYLWPTILLIVAVYQFWMFWTVSRDAGVSFAELLVHDGNGFPAESYEGGLVRMFDRFVSGFCILVVAVFMFLLARKGRKRDIQNARIHETMLNAGLISVVPESVNSKEGG